MTKQTDRDKQIVGYAIEAERNKVKDDIKTLLFEIVACYEGEGYQIKDIPQTVHDISGKYEIDLNSL